MVNIYIRNIDDRVWNNFLLHTKEKYGQLRSKHSFLRLELEDAIKFYLYVQKLDYFQKAMHTQTQSKSLSSEVKLKTLIGRIKRLKIIHIQDLMFEIQKIFSVYDKRTIQKYINLLNLQQHIYQHPIQPKLYVTDYQYYKKLLRDLIKKPQM